MSHQKIYIFLLKMKYTINSSQQTVKQVEFIQEATSQKVSKLNVSVMKKAINYPYLEK